MNSSGMGHWKEVTRITGDTDYYYCIIKLSGSPLLYDIYATMLNNLTYFRVFILFSYSVVVKTIQVV